MNNRTRFFSAGAIVTGAILAGYALKSASDLREDPTQKQISLCYSILNNADSRIREMSENLPMDGSKVEIINTSYDLKKQTESKLTKLLASAENNELEWKRSKHVYFPMCAAGIIGGFGLVLGQYDPRVRSRYSL